MPRSSAELRRSEAAWGVLLGALIVEAFLLIWVLLITVIAALGSGDSFAQNLSLVVLAAASLAWVVVTIVGLVRTHASWVRGSALTIHVLLFAAGTGCLQLALGPWWLGVGLVVLALLGFFVTLLARPAPKPEPKPEP